jgi:superfamily II DNA helicase RecQ
VDYKAAGTLQRSLDPLGKLSRDDFDGLLGAMVRARLIEIEDAVFEKDGEVKRFRKVRLTAAGIEVSPMTALALLIDDGIVEEFGGKAAGPAQTKQAKTGARSSGTKPKTATESSKLTAEQEELVTRLREWRSAEAKRLKVPAFVVLHDRTLIALAAARPATPNQLLAIDGIGAMKVERFGQDLLRLCAKS